MEGMVITCVKYVKQVCLEHQWAYIPVVVVATLASWLDVPYPVMLIVLLFFFTDLVTGIAASLKQHERITSFRLRDSIYKGISYTAFIIGAWGVGLVSTDVTQLGELGKVWGVTAACGLVIAAELYSIVENIDILGWHLPKKWLEVLGISKKS